MSFYSADDFYPDRSAGYLIRVCNQMIIANLDATLADEGVSMTQWSALISIHFGQATCAALAREMAHDKGAMTRLVDTLEARGWVERTRDSDDRRLNLLSVTPAGLEVAMRCRDRVIACWNQWLDGWAPDEAARFVAQLQRLRATLEATPACAA